MNRLSRRSLLWLGGSGIVAAAAGGVALVVRQLTRASNQTLYFQAIAALPRPPLHSYASYVLEGQIDLGKGSGTFTKTVYAGPPTARLPIALLTRQVRVTGVQQQGSRYQISGVIDNRAALQRGESASVALTIDASSHTAQSDFFGDTIQLQVPQLTTS
jgi:hypothetical protein